MTAHFTIFFIIEGSSLERQALLLSDSLRRHHPIETKIIAYVPNDYLAKMTPFSLEFLEEKRVEVIPLHVDHSTWARQYHHGNKIIACAQPRDTEYSLFIDTDTFCVDSILPDVNANDGRIFAVPEGMRTWGKNIDDWEKAYNFFNMPLPEERIRLVRGMKVKFPPYFNAGYVAFPEVHPQTGQRFGSLWLQTAVALDFGAQIPLKRPWLDQIALPISILRFGYTYKALDTAFNFSTKARQSHDHRFRLAHYHRSPAFLKWEQGRLAFDHFSSEMTSSDEGARYFGGEAEYIEKITGKRPSGGAE